MLINWCYHFFISSKHYGRVIRVIMDKIDRELAARAALIAAKIAHLRLLEAEAPRAELDAAIERITAARAAYRAALRGDKK